MTKTRLFTSARALDARIKLYFKRTKGVRLIPKQEKESLAQKTKSGLPEPEFPTFNGLALYLGFKSLEEFEEYENKSRFSTPLKRARLQMAAIYETKLHTHSYGGAAIALKMIRGEKQNDSGIENADSTPSKLEVIHSGIALASSEKDVIL